MKHACTLYLSFLKSQLEILEQSLLCDVRQKDKIRQTEFSRL